MAEEKKVVSEIDLVMSMDPLELAKDDAALDAIIAYERQARLEFELGVKAPKKDKGVTFDMNKVIAALTPGVPQQASPNRRKVT